MLAMLDVISDARSLYLTNDPTLATSALSAEEWAESEWFPSLFLPLVVAILPHFIIAYEHILHLRAEWTILYRIATRKRLTKAILPLTTLWLRYTTLLLCFVGIAIMWDNQTTAQNCLNSLLPLMFACLTIVSMSSGVASATRCRLIARAALPSTRYINLANLICLICLLARLASQVIAFSMQIKLTRVVLQSPFKSSTELHASCFAHALPFMDKLYHGDSAVLGPAYAFIGMITTVFVTDMVFAALTLICIIKLSRCVHAENALFKELVRNSIEFYSLVAVIDLACLLLYSTTKLATSVHLMVTGGSILMIRVMIKEQECIVAHSPVYTTHTKTPWLTGAGGGADGNGHVWQAGRPGRAAQGRCRSCRPRPHHASTMQVRRRGAGLTDIEVVTVLEHGRSVDRPLPNGDDEDLSRFDGQHRCGEIGSLIAEWTREVHGAMSSDEEANNGRPSWKKPRLDSRRQGQETVQSRGASASTAELFHSDKGQGTTDDDDDDDDSDDQSRSRCPHQQTPLPRPSSAQLPRPRSSCVRRAPAQSSVVESGNLTKSLF